MFCHLRLNNLIVAWLKFFQISLSLCIGYRREWAQYRGAHTSSSLLYKAPCKLNRACLALLVAEKHCADCLKVQFIVITT